MTTANIKNIAEVKYNMRDSVTLTVMLDLIQVCHLFSNLWGEFKYQLLQQTFLTVLKDGDFRQSG